MPTHKEARKRYLRIANMVRRGKSVKETAQHFGVSPATVSKACDIHSVMRTRKQGEADLSSRTWKVIAEIIKGEKSYVDIGETLGTTPDYVRNVAQKLRQAGAPIPKRRSGKQTSEPSRRN